MLVNLRKVGYNRSSFMRKYSTLKRWRLMFFGTDEFALTSLRKIYKEYTSGDCISSLEISTNTKTNRNAIKDFAHEQNLKLHPWPIEPPERGSFDLGLVVSFGHLIPERIISAFPLGMVNVHGSLLPRWRGAAPVIHCLLHGDRETGVSLMRIRPHHFDVGEVIDQSKIEIRPDMLRAELHDALAEMGADLLLNCIKNLPQSVENGVKQDVIGITYAPKVTATIANIKWNDMTSFQIYNLHRATHDLHQLSTQFHQHEVKISQPFLPLAKPDTSVRTFPPGYIEYKKDFEAIRVWCKDESTIFFKSLRMKGKRTMTAKDFKNGYLTNLKKQLHYFSDIR